MGSLGWAECYWCWAWEHNMHIMGAFGVPLCGRCQQLAIDGGGPPWWPNKRRRWRLRVERKILRQLCHEPPIPVEVCHRIAACVARPWMP